MKKPLSVLISLTLLLSSSAFLLSGCEKEEIIKKSNTITLSEYEMPQAVPISATLYYPSADFSHMLACTVTFSGTTSITENIASALFSGNTTGFVSPFPKNTQVRSLSLVQNILYIDLSSNFASASNEQFFGCISSIVYSFCEVSQVDYVNITVEGRQITSPITKKPIMLLSKYNGNVLDLINRYSASGTVDSFYALLYEYDSSKQYLLPTVRNITVSDGNYSSGIINSMLSFQDDRSIFPKGLSLLNSVSLDGNTLSVTLLCENAWEENNSWLGFECLGAALSYLYPTASFLNLKVVDKDNNTLYQRKNSVSACYDLVRSTIDVIVSDGEKLTKSSILVSRLAIHEDAKNFTKQYLETINPDFVNTQLVNDVTLLGDTVIIDLSKEYFDYYASKQLTSGEEHAIVFSLVSTLCNYTSATKVMILQNSQVRSRFIESVVLSTPLVSLPTSYLESLS